jgi:hypothetical protein
MHTQDCLAEPEVFLTCSTGLRQSSAPGSAFASYPASQACLSSPSRPVAAQINEAPPLPPE